MGTTIKPTPPIPKLTPPIPKPIAPIPSGDPQKWDPDPNPSVGSVPPQPHLAPWAESPPPPPTPPVALGVK